MCTFIKTTNSCQKLQENVTIVILSELLRNSWTNPRIRQMYSVHHVRNNKNNREHLCVHSIARFCVIHSNVYKGGNWQPNIAVFVHPSVRKSYSDTSDSSDSVQSVREKITDGRIDNFCPLPPLNVYWFNWRQLCFIKSYEWSHTMAEIAKFRCTLC